MKEKRIEKAIKKAQKKGIYNPKLKLGIVGLILVIGTVIGVSYAYYTKTATNTLTIEGTVSKKITVTVQNGGHGQVNSMDIATQQTDYGITTQSFKITPDSGYQYKSVECYNNKVETNYNKTTNTLTVTPRTSKDVSCIVKFEENFASKIILNAKNNGTYKETSPTSANCPTSSDSSCSGIYKMEDYDNINNLTSKNGTSYYFRGAVNNYVKFAEQNWRIVRVNGDGTVRLVLDSDIGTSEFNNEYNVKKYVGYTYDNTPCTNANPCKSLDIATNNEDQIGTTDHGGKNSTIKKKLEAWYYNNLRDYDQYIEYGIYCNDTSFGNGSETSGILYYGAYQRGEYDTPQLTCPDPKPGNGATSYVQTVNGIKYRTYGGVYKLKIGLLSEDEIVLAGFKSTNSNVVTESNYLYYTGSSDYFWSSSPHSSLAMTANVFNGNLSDRRLNGRSVNGMGNVRPVINLKADVTVTGSGTKGDPYVIK